MTKPISIAVKPRPFSHKPGVVVPLPKILGAVALFPTRLCFYDLQSNQPILTRTEELDVEGPIDNFTVELNGENGVIVVSGKGMDTYYIDPYGKRHQRKPSYPNLSERLSLGSHKQQEIEAIFRRLDPKEIFPIWFALGSLVEDAGFLKPEKGMGGLVNACYQGILQNRPERIVPQFLNLFRAAFYGMLTPRLEDTDCQGILPKDAPLPEVSPYVLLKEGAGLIRSLFLTQQANTLSILPSLPPELHCGRMTGVLCPGVGTLDLEWSKKRLRRLTLYANQKTSVLLKFQRDLKHCRLREGIKARGERHLAGETIQIKPGIAYFLDRFEK